MTDRHGGSYACVTLGMADWEDGCWGRYVASCSVQQQTGWTGRRGREGARERRRWKRRVGDDGCGKVKGATTHVPLTPES